MSNNFIFHEDGTAAPIDRIFVFGSNLSGFHGAGAAKAAYQFYGAKLFDFEGMTGRAYAIPTKDQYVQETLPMEAITHSIAKFVHFTHTNPNLKFFVTRVGCGLAGLKDATIAPLFFEAKNCSFPDRWKPFLESLE